MTSVGAMVRYATVLVLTFSLGLHWAFLQTVAWTGMIASYSQDSSLSEAIFKTFDGAHPCKLCIAIEQGRAAEKKSDQEKNKTDNKLDLGILSEPFIFYAACPSDLVTASDSHGRLRLEQPPKPHPRSSPDNLA